MTKRVQSVELVKILNKYESLFLEITQEVSDENYSGLNIFSINAPDLKDFEVKAKEILGEDGTRQEVIFEEGMQKYLGGENSFTETCRQLFGDKPIDTYLHLTANYSLKVTPKIMFKEINIQNMNLVIDYTTLLGLVSITKNIGIKFEDKFLISSYVIEHIEQELRETINSPSPTLSLKVTQDIVKPHFYNSNFKQNRIDYFKDILKWINENCIVRPVFEKLDVIRQMDKTKYFDDPYYQYIVDTAFLGSHENTILISDDSIFHKLLYESGHLISTESYLYKVYSRYFIVEMLPLLIEQNYLGIVIYGENLKDEFDKSYGQQNSTFVKCLNNLNPQISLSNYSIQSILEFVKFLYLKPLLIEEKKRISQQTFSAFLKGIPDNTLQKIHNGIQLCITTNFFLLPQYKDIVLEDFESAIRLTRNG